jgi:hypothetical protein
MATERDAQGKFLPQNREGTSTSKQLQVVISAVDQFTASYIKKITLDCVANLRRAPSEGGTPVDTGWARANWFVGIGRPSTRDGNFLDPDSGDVAEANSAAETGLGSVLAYTLAAGSVYITNNVPYILRLNDGYSQQAPAGFVQRAIQEAVTGQRQAA